MKKLAIGCLVVLVLGGVGVAGVSYYLYRQARTMLSQFAELGQVPEIERGVRARGPYAPPQSGEITSEQLQRLLRVQAHVRERLGERIAKFEQKYKALAEKEHATVVDVPTLMAAYRDLAEAWMTAKRSQVEGLNETGLSLEEYRWIREQAYRALGVPYVDLDVGRIVEQINTVTGSRQEQPGELRGSFGPAGPESNRKLVEPFKKQLETNLPLASFGL